MTVYTSYFGAVRKYFPKEEFIRTAICYKPPRGFGIWNNVVPAPELVYGMKRGEVTPEEYEERYYSMLMFRKDFIAENVPYLLQGEKNVVLLCYEKPNDWCHRHILARFLREQFGLDVQEFNPESVQ